MKNASALLAMCLLCAVSPARDARAQDARPPEPERHPVIFQLSSDMVMFGSPPTRLFLGWQGNVNALLQLGFDGVSDHFDLRSPGKAFYRLGVLAVFTGAGYIVNQAFSVTAHDDAHMEAARAIGASDVGLVGESGGPAMSIWEFFLYSFNFTAEAGLYTYNPVNPTLEKMAYVSGEGLDTNMLIADNIGRQINQGTGHITDLAPYVLNKLWGINYFLVTGPSSDAADYMDLLSAQGYNTVTAANVIALSAASCLLSGGFVSLMRGTLDYIVQGDSTVEPLGLRLGEVRVFWPELTTWLNPDNVSVLVMVDASWRDTLSLRAGLDTPVLGNTGEIPELTLGVGVRFQMVSLGMEITTHFTGLPFFLGNVEVDLTDVFSLGIEAYYGQRTTMREPREFPLGPGVFGFVKAKL
jgi:hypothetical protein